MRREVPVRFREGVGVKFPRSTRLIILVSTPPGPEQQQKSQEAAEQEKTKLAEILKEKLGLELSEAKTLVTPVTEKLKFLGHQIRVRAHPVNGNLIAIAVIPKERSQKLRECIKSLFKRNSLKRTLKQQLQLLNPILRGWGNFYRHAWGAKRIFSGMDYYVWWTIFRWLKKKHPGVKVNSLIAKYGWRKPGKRNWAWREDRMVPFQMAKIPVRRFRMAWQKTPSFARTIYGEPGA
jgi:RNA-directed DNA polymerase